MSRRDDGFVILDIVIILVILFVLVTLSTYIIPSLKRTSQPNNTKTPNITEIPNSQWKIYNNTKLNFSFEYPSNWVIDTSYSQTMKTKSDKILLALKEKQFREGMGTSWINVHVYSTTNMDDVLLFGNKVEDTTINKINWEEWQNKDTNQKYLITKTNSKIFEIQSRIKFESNEKDIEVIYNHLLNSFKIVD
jgi:PsbP-like protein